MLLASALVLSMNMQAIGEQMRRGFCVGSAWIELRDGERVTDHRGPDGTTMRVVTRSGRDWSAGTSEYGTVAVPGSLGAGPVVFRARGILVRRLQFVPGAPAHVPFYFMAPMQRSADGREEFYYDKHMVVFAGSAFSGTSDDLAFFDRVRAGPEAHRKCAAHWKRMNG